MSLTDFYSISCRLILAASLSPAVCHSLIDLQVCSATGNCRLQRCWHCFAISFFGQAMKAKKSLKSMKAFCDVSALGGTLAEQQHDRHVMLLVRVNLFQSTLLDISEPPDR